MYKKALKDLITHATNEFFKQHTEYKEVCCYKVDFDKDSTTCAFTARLVACDNDPKFGEWFTIQGYLCYEIEFTRITDSNEKVLYSRW